MRDDSREILLVNSNLMKPPVSPVAIDFLASSLKANGFAVRFLDLAFEKDVGAALERALAQTPLFVGVSIRNIDDSFFATSDFCLSRVRPIVQKIKNLTDAPVVLGGVGYSIFPIATLEYCGGNYGIQGDGETAIVRLAKAFLKGEASFEIPGLIFHSNGRYWRNRPASVDLSSLDLSDRSAVDNPRYLREGGMVGFETKRGCASPCSYCADPLSKGKLSRQRLPEQVAREVAGLVDHGVDHFQTCDSEFNIPYAHAREISREFIRFGLGEKIRWYAYMAPIPFDDELAALMKRAGCAGINFGADHCNPLLLKVLGRTHTKESIADASRFCNKHGIACMFDLLLGAPGETSDTLREVVDFMKRIGPSCVGAAMGVRMYPGTVLGENLAAHIRDNAKGFYGLHPTNSDLLRPVYYVSPELGENPQQLLFDMVAGDERFFVASPERNDGDYNYNDNSILAEAIRAGERGTFWYILMRLKARRTPTGIAASE